MYFNAGSVIGARAWENLPSFSPVSKILDCNMERTAKVCLIAVAAFAVCAIELSCPPLIGVAAGVSCGALTWIFEKYVREGSELERSWFDVNRIPQADLVKNILFCIVVNAIATPILFQVGLVSATVVVIQSGNISMIISEIVIMPLAFELLFRGFVQERAEDLLSLTCSNSIDIRNLANWIQAVVSLFSNPVPAKFVPSFVRRTVPLFLRFVSDLMAGSRKNEKCMLSHTVLSIAARVGLAVGSFFG